eukprot:2780207-Rhodomonas_salina.1
MPFAEQKLRFTEAKLGKTAIDGAKADTHTAKSSTSSGEYTHSHTPGMWSLAFDFGVCGVVSPQLFPAKPKDDASKVLG